MPDGYKCDRCSEFVETGRLVRDGPHGPPRRVGVVPESGDGETFEHHEYTLCPRCRRELINWVESYE